ncbi:class I SAM-dependent methyltransferase [Candidatus Dependentiae bacterium]
MIIQHKNPQGQIQATIQIEKLKTGKQSIKVSAVNTQNNLHNLFIPYAHWETNYSPQLIKEILDIKGPAYLCDEIMRDECPEYLEKSLTYSILSYVEKQAFANKRILDFGCGAGASTMILNRMFSDLDNVKIVGVELEEKFIKLAQSRAKHHNYDNITFLRSPDSNSLPENLGTFDYVILSAVFEHLLPKERKQLFPKIWGLLNPGGILFLNRTPYRYFPIETHTTGLPFINYLPDKLVRFCAHKLSKRNLKNDTWDMLLRKGIRGASIREITHILQHATNKQSKPIFRPIFLQPNKLGLKDRVDLWHHETNTTKHKRIKNIIFLLLKALKITTGTTLVPNLSLAIKKSKA